MSQEQTVVQTEKLRRPQRVEQAIEHALAHRWDAAVEANRALLEEQPDDVETANRLGKALTELQDYKGAIEAYAQAVSTDPVNPIARKNLARLSELRGEPAPKQRKTRKRPAVARARSDARAHSLVEESGKSAEFELLEPNASALKPLTAGDAAAVRPADSGVEITTPRGAVLGTIDRRAALRLKRMIEGGNEYIVVIRHIARGEASVHIRESRTDPSLAGQASFIAPAKKRTTTRAYTRSSVVVPHEPEAPDPDDDDHDAQDSVGGSDSADRSQAGEMQARGFTETGEVEVDVDESDESDDPDELEDEDGD